MRIRAVGATAVAVSVGILLGRASASAAIRNLRLRLADVEYQLLHDPLTALLNRTGLIGHYVATAVRPRWMILVDVDDFKAVNDCHGHQIGDALLRAFSAHLRSVAEDHGGVAGRIGGDEFVLLLPYRSDQPDGGVFVAALRPAVPVPGIADCCPAVSASAGACLAGPTLSWSASLRRADVALLLQRHFVIYPVASRFR